MAGAYGVGLPYAIGSRLGPLASILEHLGISFYLGGGSRFIESWAWIAFAAALAFFLPNTQELTRLFEPALDFNLSTQTAHRRLAPLLTWEPSPRWAALLGFLTVLSLLSLNRPNEFLYFQF
jgi:hypothetical protein